jgi:hypothetical protein
MPLLPLFKIGIRIIERTYRLRLAGELAGRMASTPDCS